MFGIPRMSPLAKFWKRWSSIFTAFPLPMMTERPWAAHHMPRVAMKDGILTFVLRIPLRNPVIPPIARAIGHDPEPDVVASEVILDEEAGNDGAERNDPLRGEVHGADEHHLVHGRGR